MEDMKESAIAFRNYFAVCINDAIFYIQGSAGMHILCHCVLLTTTIDFPRGKIRVEYLSLSPSYLKWWV